jgi:hypothetical protein
VALLVWRYQPLLRGPISVAMGCSQQPSAEALATTAGAAEPDVLLKRSNSDKISLSERGSLRPFQPARQRLSDGQDRREHNLRQDGFPQHRSPFIGRSSQGKPGAGRFARRDRRAEESNARAGRLGVASRPEALDCAHSRHDQAAPARRKHRRRNAVSRHRRSEVNRRRPVAYHHRRRPLSGASPEAGRTLRKPEEQ